jgi:alpha-N-arabinofuranosidase
LAGFPNTVNRFLNSFIRHADVLKIANLAQIVNVIAPILTRGDAMLLQSIFYPFEMFARRRNGISLQPIVVGPAYEGKTNGRVNYIDASAILDGDRLHAFAINRHLDESARLQIQIADRTVAALENGESLTGPNAKAVNTFEQPNLIKTQSFSDARVIDGKGEGKLAPLSVTALTFRLG